MKKLINNKKFIIMAIIILALVIAGILFLVNKLTPIEKELVEIMNNLHTEYYNCYTVKKLVNAKRFNMKKSFDEDDLKEIYSENGVNENTHIYLITVITEEDGLFSAMVTENGKILDISWFEHDKIYDNFIFKKDKIDLTKINKKID